MTPEHRKNLETLRDYLRSGELKAEFDMRKFGSEHGPTCGTVGCALGHATFCVEPLQLIEVWEDYSKRVLGVKSWSDAWQWLFSWSWSMIDNTPEGAAARIDWYLQNGVPDDWADQLEGDAPLCYRQGT